ncbi:MULTISPECIES: DUF2975 domain-containing protein [unclassified Variovorax]|jgi:hypothetical protein|uniref:DUF2975 domain-containing protein n=1 Tax=unclassified Variovorax TaxID=663243 RepID=UPI000F7EFB0D|nr:MULTISPECIES: DUF2975 domain-containing protein [unclassified Variovorax]RSZ47716.1 DUF2975 domain-containing protein [Variovorax sp. 553]RSZ48157.1 DUF2975 domain-containing protein [Variovorax sp. 679]
MQHTPAPAATPSFYLKRHAQVVQALVLAGAALLVAQPVLLLTASDWLEIFGLGSFLGLPNLPADAAGRWRTALVSLLPVGGGLYALLHLWRLFGEYGRGRVFGATAQDALVRFAWAVLLLALLLPLARGLMTVALSIGNPPGQRFLSISIAWFDCLHILFGAVLVAIARVMVEARRLADDNAGFV